MPGIRQAALLTGGDLSHGNTNTVYRKTWGELVCALSDI